MPPLPQCSGAWSGGKLIKNMRIPKYFHKLNEAEQADWMKAKKEKLKSYFAKWYAENPDKTKAYFAKYRAENPDKVKAETARHKQRNHNKKTALKFFQMTQALSEIANINTEKK